MTFDIILILTALAVIAPFKYSLSVFNNLIASNCIARLDRLSLSMRFDEMRLDTVGSDLIESHRTVVSRPYNQIINIKIHGSRPLTSATFI